MYSILDFIFKSKIVKYFQNYYKGIVLLREKSYYLNTLLLKIIMMSKSIYITKWYEDLYDVCIEIQSSTRYSQSIYLDNLSYDDLNSIVTSIKEKYEEDEIENVNLDYSILFKVIDFLSTKFKENSFDSSTISEIKKRLN